MQSENLTQGPHAPDRKNLLYTSSKDADSIIEYRTVFAPLVNLMHTNWPKAALDELIAEARAWAWAWAMAMCIVNTFLETFFKGTNSILNWCHIVREE